MLQKAMQGDIAENKRATANKGRMDILMIIPAGLPKPTLPKMTAAGIPVPV